MKTRAWLEYDGKLNVYGYVICIEDKNIILGSRLMDIPPDAMKVIIEKFNRDYAIIEKGRKNK